MLKKIILVIVLGLGAGAGYIGWRYPSVIRDIVKGPANTVPVRVGGADMALPDAAAFRQDTADWTEDTMGQTSDTLGRYGCTVTSVANAISNVTGTLISPKQLNEKLGQVGGYTSRGWLIWSKVTEATDGAVRITVHDEPTHEGIAACMADGGYPVVKIKLGGVIPHWVLLVGRKDGEYIMRDPLVGVPDDPAIPVSVRGNKIYSLRCLSKV